MEQGITPEDLTRMRVLAAKGNLTEDRTVDPEAWPDDVELVHLTDVVEMQRLLSLAADELERLYRNS